MLRTEEEDGTHTKKVPGTQLQTRCLAQKNEHRLLKMLAKYNSLRLYNGQTRFVSDAALAIQEKSVALLESPTGTGKTLAALLAAIYYLEDSFDVPAGVLPEVEAVLREIYQKRNKVVIYGCRTHEQIEQVLSEAKRIHQASGLCFSAVAFGSKNMTCIHPFVRKACDINNACRLAREKKKCTFYNEVRKEARIPKESTSGPAVSIEDAVHLGKKSGICPYFYLKQNLSAASLIVVPHALLVQPEFFADHRIPEKEILVVIDEAHNIYETAMADKSVDIAVSDMVSVAQRIEEYRSHENKCLEILELYILLQKILQYAKSNPETVQEINRFLYETGICDANTQDISDAVEKKNVSSVLFPLSEHNIENRMDKAVREIGRFCKLLNVHDKDSYISITNGFFSLRPIFVRNHLKHLDKSTVLLVGGTLSPPQGLAELFSRPLVMHSYPAVCNRVKLSVCTDFLFTYTRRSAEIERMLSLLGIYEKKIRSGGILVFMQSKEALRAAREKVYAMKSREKNITTDENAPGGIKTYSGHQSYLFETDTTLAAYKDVIKKRKKAVMFCVMGGTLSEGVNFSDELCRVLIVAGIPLPRATKEVLFVNEKKGSEYFLNRGMSVVNQTIGRAVRSVSDYSYVILLDKRFVQQQHKLSSWLAEHVQVTSSPEITDDVFGFLDKCRRKE